MADAFKCDYCGEYKDGVSPACEEDAPGSPRISYTGVFEIDVPLTYLPLHWGEVTNGYDPIVKVTIKLPFLPPGNKVPEVCRGCLIRVLKEGYKLIVETEEDIPVNEKTPSS